MRITFGQFHDIVTEMFEFHSDADVFNIIHDWYVEWKSSYETHFMSAEEFLKGRYGHCNFSEHDIQFKVTNG